MEIDMSEGELFCDPDFEPSDAVLFDETESDFPPEGMQHVTQWLRLPEIHANPQLFVDGVTAGDIEQGGLGDCWFLSALTCLGTRLDLLQHVFVSAAPKKGKYVLRFFLNGRFTNVTIDDRLPCNAKGVPVFAKCSDANEFWVSLIEKAYAKVYGAYSQLEKGLTRDALVDMTGGVSDKIEVGPPGSTIAESLWDTLVKEPTSYERLLGCIAFGDGIGEGPLGDTGLLKAHAYGIMRVATIPDGTRLVQCRNPWGSGGGGDEPLEWNGAWSDFDTSGRWTVDLRMLLDHTEDANDGLFWMSFDDFCTHFDEVEVCKVFPESKWTTKVEIGEWKGESAAGRFHYAPAVNPQYVLDVHTRGVAVVALRQKEARFAGDDKFENVHIGMQVVRAPLGARLIHLNVEDCMINTDPWIDAREIAEFTVLDKGKYIVGVSTFEPGVESDFMVRVLMNHSRFDLRPAPSVAECYASASVEGTWTSENSGGNSHTFHWVENDMYVLTVPSSLVLTLLLVQDQEPRAHAGIYLLPAQDGVDYSFNMSPVLEPGPFSNERTSIVTGRVEPGTYVVVPATYDIDRTGSYRLEAYAHLSELPDGVNSLSLTPSVQNKSYVEVLSSWAPGTAGGCNNFDSWVTNPKFNLTIHSDDPEASIYTTVMVAQDSPDSGFAVGFLITDVGSTDILGQSANWSRGVFQFASFYLTPGTYVIYPCTFNPEEYSGFMVRAYAHPQGSVTLESA